VALQVSKLLPNLLLKNLLLKQPVAEEPATEAPGETEGPAPAAQEGGWCSGTNIVFFPGGSPGGGFETVVYNGALQAAADLRVPAWNTFGPIGM
jgi:hypothetical protein